MYAQINQLPNNEPLIHSLALITDSFCCWLVGILYSFQMINVIPQPSLFDRKKTVVILHNHE